MYFFFVVILCASLFALPAFSEKPNFKKIDKAVSGMRRTRKIEKVIKFIARRAKNDWERARGAYVWIAKNIEYDVEALHSEIKERKEGNDVFASRKSVCQGYAELFSEIARGLGLEVVVINGYAKGYGYTAGTRFENTNHAWNAVKIDNKWWLMETTWGAGNIDNVKFIPDYTTAWFDTDPRLFVLNHFPEDTCWMLTNSPLTLSEYEEMPYIESHYLEAFSTMGGKTSDLIIFLEQGSVPKFWTYPRICPQLTD